VGTQALATREYRTDEQGIMNDEVINTRYPKFFYFKTKASKGQAPTGKILRNCKCF
jgi:hypothetical protein